ncbi:hypothetical protein GA565_09750 [Rouxiella sp. S1S-2]|uniref:hypothetical protein n=1 Tax=Rouxiella sp. S1S-2 TaxID=2653856 RepID=UPI0012659FFF|nr:hypothetical protein [Rouxiella sp. S1S-2]KAB7896246.1 hypothetical protein GA565_09750 [Rouxiella sp. S1S-2]
MLNINTNNTDNVNKGDSSSVMPIPLAERLKNTVPPKYTPEDIIKSRKLFNNFILNQISTEFDERMKEEKESIAW